MNLQLILQQAELNQQGTNIYSQVYKYIKYKDEYFSDAIDV